MSQENPQNLPASINVDSDGVLKPKNIEEAFRLAKAFSISGMVPDRYNGKPEMVLAATQMALELGLKPLTGLCKIAVVKGTPTVFGDLPLAMVQASKQLEYIKEFYFDADGAEISMKNKNLTAPVFGAVCVVKRKGDSEPREAYFTMQEANDAGLLNGRGDAWAKYPKMMLKYRARSQALKDKFPDALNGISIAEYDHNASESEIIDVRPSTSTEKVISDVNASRSLAEKLAQKRSNVIDVSPSNEEDNASPQPVDEVSND